MLKIIMAIVIVAALAVGAVFINDYFDKADRAEALAQQIQTDSNNLSTLSVRTREMNDEIQETTEKTNQVLDDLADASRAVPEAINPNIIINGLLVLGQSHEVTVIPLSAQPWSGVKIGNNEYQVFRMSLEIYGEYEDTVQFIKELNDLYETLAVESLSLEKSLETPEPDPETGEEQDPFTVITANLRLAVYAR